MEENENKTKLDKLLSRIRVIEEKLGIDVDWEDVSYTEDEVQKNEADRIQMIDNEKAEIQREWEEKQQLIASATTYKELQSLATKFGYRQEWAWYKAKERGLV